MGPERAYRLPVFASVIILLAGCAGPWAPRATETPVPTATEEASSTMAVTPTSTDRPTPTTPSPDITLTAPEEGTAVSSPVEVRGRVTVMPFEGTLRGRVYDAQGDVLGEVPIQATADKIGELGGPGSFHGTIPFQVEDAGDGQVEVAEVSVRDGSLVASTTVPVTLMPHEPPDQDDMDVREAWTSPSPDGMWVARGLAAFPADSQQEHENRYYTRLSVARSDGSGQWTVLDKWHVLALGYTTPQPLQWSSDGRFFYFTNRPVPDGCAVFVNGSDLQRVDLSDGSVTEIVPSVGLWLSLSPDETTLAYVGYGNRGLVLRDLSDGTERRSPIETAVGQGDAHLGHIVWSPDGSTLMLTVAFDACGPPDGRTHAIVRVDAPTLAQSVVVPADPRLFITEAWPEADRVSLRDGDGDAWDLDPWTGDLRPR